MLEDGSPGFRFGKTSSDTLGFDPYVDAISQFLLNEETQPPLTLSVEGEWGSGKTSFMLQLKERIDSAGGKTVHFMRSRM